MDHGLDGQIRRRNTNVAEILLLAGRGGMRGRFVLAIAVVTIAFLSATAPGQAEFRVCNKSTERVDVALGYDGGRKGWIAEGWWGVGVGKCVTLLGGRLNNRYYYLYAKGDDGNEWDGEEDEGG